MIKSNKEKLVLTVLIGGLLGASGTYSDAVSAQGNTSISSEDMQLLEVNAGIDIYTSGWEKVAKEVFWKDEFPNLEAQPWYDPDFTTKELCMKAKTAYEKAHKKTYDANEQAKIQKEMSALTNLTTKEDDKIAKITAQIKSLEEKRKQVAEDNLKKEAETKRVQGIIKSAITGSYADEINTIKEQEMATIPGYEKLIFDIKAKEDMAKSFVDIAKIEDAQDQLRDEMYESDWNIVQGYADEVKALQKQDEVLADSYDDELFKIGVNGIVNPKIEKVENSIEGIQESMSNVKESIDDIKDNVKYIKKNKADGETVNNQFVEMRESLNKAVQSEKEDASILKHSIDKTQESLVNHVADLQANIDKTQENLDNHVTDLQANIDKTQENLDNHVLQLQAHIDDAVKTENADKVALEAHVAVVEKQAIENLKAAISEQKNRDNEQDVIREEAVKTLDGKVQDLNSQIDTFARNQDSRDQGQDETFASIISSVTQAINSPVVGEEKDTKNESKNTGKSRRSKRAVNSSTGLEGLTGAITESKKATDNRFKDIEAVNVRQDQDINTLYNDVKETGAASAALSALHPMVEGPKSQVMVGAGHYRGKSAMAVGVAYKPSNNVSAQIGSTLTGSHKMVNAGITFGIGQGRVAADTVDETTEMKKRITVLEEQVKELMAQLSAK